MSKITAICCQHVGVTMGEITVVEIEGGYRATQPIGTLFGSEVDGECVGTGATKELALEDLRRARIELENSLWV